MESPTWPHVTCVIPVRNDATGLPRAIASVLRQDYPGELSVVIAVGPSTDGTEQIAGELAVREPCVEVVENPSGGTASGLNRAMTASRGTVIARVDARSELGPGYLVRAVELLTRTGAANVGGLQVAVGRNAFTQAVAIAMSSRFGAGGARFHVGGAPGPVDTVYLGVFRRRALEEVGGFDEGLVRNQDYELNIRLRERGGVVYFHPDLRVSYEPRPTLRSLGRQYLEYGMWKRVVIRRHPGSLRWRQAVPPVAVVANLVALILGVVGQRRALLVPLSYVISTVAASLSAGRGHPPRVVARLPLVFATMHHAWGAGFLVGPRSRGASTATGDELLE